MHKSAHSSTRKITLHFSDEVNFVCFETTACQRMRNKSYIMKKTRNGMQESNAGEKKSYYRGGQMILISF